MSALKAAGLLKRKLQNRRSTSSSTLKQAGVSDAAQALAVPLPAGTAAAAATGTGAVSTESCSSSSSSSSSSRRDNVSSNSIKTGSPSSGPGTVGKPAPGPGPGSEPAQSVIDLNSFTIQTDALGNKTLVHAQQVYRMQAHCVVHCLTLHTVHCMFNFQHMHVLQVRQGVAVHCSSACRREL